MHHLLEYLSSPFVAHHNQHINVLVVYLLMQELLANKMPFFKFVSTGGKLWLGQLKSYSTASCAACSFLWKDLIQFHCYKEGEIACAKHKYI